MEGAEAAGAVKGGRRELGGGHVVHSVGSRGEVESAHVGHT